MRGDKRIVEEYVIERKSAFVSHLCSFDDILRKLSTCFSLSHPRVIRDTHIRPICSVVVVGGDVGSCIVVVGTSSLVEKMEQRRHVNNEMIVGGRCW